MDLAWSQEQLAFRDSVMRFATSELGHAVRESEAAATGDEPCDPLTQSGRRNTHAAVEPSVDAQDAVDDVGTRRRARLPTWPGVPPQRTTGVSVC